jgi:nitrous oxidase accessory protein
VKRSAPPAAGRAAALALAAALAAAAAPAGPAAAATLEVGPGRSHATIGAALLAARPGDRIEVAPGTYRENLAIEVEGVELVGRGGPVVAGSGRGDVVRVVADGATVRGFAVRGSGDTMMTSDAGIKVLGDRVTIAGNRLADNLFGVYLDRCREALIEGNEITGRAEVDVGRRGAGIHFFDAHDNVVRGNRVAFVRDGVYFDHSDRNTLEDNEFHHLRYGVHYMYCEDNRFFRNVFRDSVAGVAIMYSERVTFSDNRILDNREGFHAFGLLLKDARDSVAERNVIVNNGSGIFLDGSHRNRFEHNLVAYNDAGVVLYASSLDNAFADNDFVGNLATLRTVGRAEADWSPDGRGNHYSDYGGYDLDGDGRGDAPHRLQDAFEVLVGNHPLLQVFLSSAAAGALAAAERSFPLVPSSEQVDRAPAMRPASGVGAAAATARRRRGAAPATAGWLAVVAITGWSALRGRR